MASTMFVAAQGPSQDGFVAVQPGQPGQEQLPATPLVFTAYAFVWVALLVYVLTLWRRLTRVERELVDVTARLEARRR
jgi:CcmD family protein